MKQKSISFCQGKGSLTHNNREFVAENIDRERMKNNITFVRQSIAEAYEILFAKSTASYNTKQKRNDRKIKDSYYESLFGCKPCNTVKTTSDKRKSFYEDIVQIGTKEDSGFGTDDADLVIECLKEYMAGFQERNPNFHVFNAVLHMDEATPHLHIDYIPVGHYKRGQDTQNGLTQALKEMGFGVGKDAIARWRESEVNVLGKICKAHGIIPKEPQKSRGTLTIPEYKEQKLKTLELAEHNAEIELQIAEKEKQRDEILDFQPKYEATERLEFKFMDMCEQLDELLKSPISAVKNKKKIGQLAEKMKNALIKSYKARDKAETLAYEVRKINNEIADSRDKLADRVRKLSDRNRELYQASKSLQTYEDMIDALKRDFPVVYKELKSQQNRKSYNEKIAPKKTKSFELE
ncbi:MAG: plasmid recombination protein [Ruminococcus sp.]|nr:plasmid recombination protein [Ruminococcus sp.]